MFTYLLNVKSVKTYESVKAVISINLRGKNDDSIGGSQNYKFPKINVESIFYCLSILCLCLSVRVLYIYDEP